MPHYPNLSRRGLIGFGAAIAGLSFKRASASPPDAQAFSSTQTPNLFDSFAERALALAQRGFAATPSVLPRPFAALDYDGYRRLRPRDERAIFGAGPSQFSVLPLPRGFLFRDSVSLSIANRDGVFSIQSSEPYVDFIDYPDSGADARANLGISGWRLLQRLGGGAYREMAVFQGGVYFRAVADHLAYGLSARALTLSSGSPSHTEEFPHFSEFCIVEPQAGEQSMRAYALLDSPSIAGAYQFDIAPGRETVIDVRARLFPRADLSEMGLAAASSMFARGSADTQLVIRSDSRPEVHDSDGLAIDMADGTRLWRPLTNPRRARISSFPAAGVQGFGLVQRGRALEFYRDGEARYENRPSLWVNPRGEWGAGAVTLVELPTANEYNDNIVAFWRPDEPWRAGGDYAFNYRLTWNAAGPPRDQRARILQTSIDRSSTFAPIFTLDFANAEAAASAAITTSRGAIANQSLSHPTPDLTRLRFTLQAPSASPVELRAVLHDAQGMPLSETWAFRWP